MKIKSLNLGANHSNFLGMLLGPPSMRQAVKMKMGIFGAVQVVKERRVSERGTFLKNKDSVFPFF